MNDLAISFDFTCPAPLRRYPQIVLGHGSGGRMTEELISNLFAPAFAMDGDLSDAAVLLPEQKGRLVFSTDSFVVNPPIFPGGDIGSLAVAGTVNDLAMMGAKPLYLSAGFVLEEGLEMDKLAHIVYSMAQTAHQAGVKIVTGDTKVVDRGHGDEIYINTSGVGVLEGEGPHPKRAKPGDVLIVNGPLGDHGVAVMSLRHGLGLEGEILSDSAPLNDLVQNVMDVCPDIHVLRDLTRGGLAAAACEIAKAANVGFEIDEFAVPVRDAVAGACEILGLDVFCVANEGKLLAVVPGKKAGAVLAAMKKHALGKDAAIIGRVTSQRAGQVMAKTPYGSERLVDLPAGELLPRIC